MFNKRKRKPIRGSRKFHIKELPWVKILKSTFALIICGVLVYQIVGYRHYYNKSINAIADNTDLSKKVEVLASDLDTKKLTIDKLVADKEASTQELRDSIASLNKQLDETVKENQELSSDLDGVKSANDVLRQKLNTLLGTSSRSGTSLSPTATGISGLTLADLKKLTKGTGLVGTEEAFLSIEKTNNVNALFALAVAKHESGNGFSSLSKNKNNVFGFRGSKGWMSFKTKTDSVLYFGRLIQKNYVRKGYDTPAKIGPRYAEGSKVWAPRIIEFMLIDLRKVH